MSNLRILYDNAADRATVTASSTAGALAAANLLTDTKSDVWRATGTSARLTLAWAVAEAIQAVALPFCNLSPTATMRVRATNEAPVANLNRYTDDFSIAVWSRGDCSVATSATLAPSGAGYAVDLIENNNASSVQHLLSSNHAVEAGKTYTRSVFAKVLGSGAKRYLTLAFASSAFGVNHYATFDLVAGTYVTSATGVTAGMKLINGYYRCSITAACITSVSNGSSLIRLGNAYTATAQTYVGDGVSGLTIWGAMTSEGTLSSYFPSVASAATRPAGYIDSWQSYDYDSGAQLACPAPALRPRGWTAAQAASAYAYGGGAYARMWLPAAVQAVGLAIDIVDANNVQGYIEAARLVAGPYWSPMYNASEASMSLVDTTDLYRTDAGDQGASAGYVYRRVPISLSAMPAADRAAFVSIVRSSRALPILLSVFPDSADLALERDHMVYGRRSKDSDVAIQYAASYSTTIEIEEI